MSGSRRMSHGASAEALRKISYLKIVSCVRSFVSVDVRSYVLPGAIEGVVGGSPKIRCGLPSVPSAFRGLKLSSFTNRAVEQVFWMCQVSGCFCFVLSCTGSEGTQGAPEADCERTIIVSRFSICCV